VGLERIAWIASALSVGIGFGLQAIVQNFISGLILLAERPVKVGDWVVVGDAEGDIRRINVRATEIQTGDRTTVLVPNSELITKTVRNRTYSNAEGLVKVVLPMPLATDADLVRELLLEAFREHPGILDAPAPAVLIDGISDKGQVLFSATGFVATPRQAASTRSALLFEILRRLRQLNIRMV
jgi:small-conductance mechanosensitive channel